MEEVRCSTGVATPFNRVRRGAEVAEIGRAVVVNGVLNGAITKVKEGGDYSQLKRGQSY
jgi:hypothetical protein